MEFVLHFEVPLTRLLSIIQEPGDKGLVFVLGKDRFDVRTTYLNGKVHKFIAVRNWDITQIKKMWTMERKLKRANITFHVREVNK
ncbi:MAG: hypothetical protein ACRC0G_13055 [Fusobacteriaceae bacterium]